MNNYHIKLYKKMSELVSTSVEKPQRLPEPKTMQNAAQLAIVEDRPIMLDYWTDSLKKEVIIGVRSDGMKMLIKSEEEYTSHIEKVYKVQNKETNNADFIIMTENSIYLVDGNIPNKRVSFEN